MPPPDSAPVEDALHEHLARVKPRLRGWLHLGTFPLVAAAGLVLVMLSPTLLARVGAAVFTATGMLLFGVSAVYHRGSWSPRVWRLLRRLDHSNIFLLIAGTYTPFALLLLSGSDRWLVLAMVWCGAVLGVAFRTLWVGAPRWLYTPVYLALGWVAVFWIDEFARSAGPATLTLIVVGGLLYSLGGLVYALKRPDPSPRWFGFHEIFHTLTIAAYGAHYVGLSLISYQAG
ncbi:MAG: hemolysin III family protein [Actinomycetota bacterium]|nr:hemolysin III family protein [Actinomycetota bacterium]